MNILLLGGGGREHALAWKLAQSRAIADGGVLWASPGNPGIAEHARLATLDAADHAGVAAFCNEWEIGLVVIGPEAPLVDGLADALRGAGIAVFGPSKAAARLEGSKSFTKDLCTRAGIPTAGYTKVTSVAEGRAALDRYAAPYVLKADGLAAGKGVVIADTRAEAEAALADMLGVGHGAKGAELVIEEFMHGEEASFFALTDGTAILPFGTAQDHKRAFDGDAGPNTGGMGAYSPATILTPALHAEVMERIIAPTVRQLAEDGSPYSGVLYAGLMLTEEGPKLVEYNCRFGDPECQVLMARFEGDLAETLYALRHRAPRRARTAALLRRGRAHRGDGGERLSRHTREGWRHYRGRASRGERRARVPGGHQGRDGRQAVGRWRTGAGRHRYGRRHRGGAHPCLPGGRGDRLPHRLLPPRHWLAGTGPGR